MEPMLSVAQAHARLMQLFSPAGIEDVALARCASRVLRRDAVATRSQPPFPSSAMDGYAIRSADGQTGLQLQVIGTSAAGQRFQGSVGPREAVRIYTGAPVPKGAERILIQENVTRSGDSITVTDGSDMSSFIRPEGGDFVKGARVEAPRRLSPSDLALLASMNVARLGVARRPDVSLIPTGDELVIPGDVPGPDQIMSSNSYGLKAMLEAAGAEVRLMPVASDTAESLTAVFDLCSGADLIVTIGGASVGDFDLVQQTAMDRGLELDFYKVAMRPGKPLMAGRLGAIPMIGLPGNPVSAIVCAQLFIIPAVKKMLGLPAGPPARSRASLGVAIGQNGPREHYMRAKVVAGKCGWLCTPFERQDSSLLSVLSQANALMVREPDAQAQNGGEMVEFIWL